MAVILGTRPEIIKMSPIVREMERVGMDFFILHTGQHYSYNMDRVFFEQLRLPEPKYNLEVGSGTHAEETGRMMIGIEKVLTKEKPDLVLVEGDTNTVVAGALASVKLGIKVGHVEAGLRSFDRSMPEEINRIVADHVSALLFAPTERARQNLFNEGISRNVYVTGNTIVDVVYQNLKLAEVYHDFMDLGAELSSGYFLATIHRQENVDNPQRFREIIKGLNMVQERFGKSVLYIVHPRAKKSIEKFEIDTGRIILLEPLDYLTFLRLESKADLIFTDSGGVQEEACILGVPCITLRYNTERPETVDVGANIITGTNPYEIVKKTRILSTKNRRWSQPFGDGKAAVRIVEILSKKLW